MKTLLISAHTPSENTQKLAEAAQLGANHPDIKDAGLTIRVVLKSALETTVTDVLQADGILLGTTENFGYMAGLTKDFFERCYYPVLEKKQGLPVGVYIRAGLDGTGTRIAIEKVITGLSWQWVQPPLICQGELSDALKKVETLAMNMSAGIASGIY